MVCFQCKLLIKNMGLFDSKHLANLNQVSRRASAEDLERILGKEEKLVCQVETFTLGSPWMQRIFQEVRDVDSVPSVAEPTSSPCRRVPRRS